MSRVKRRTVFKVSRTWWWASGPRARAGFAAPPGPLPPRRVSACGWPSATWLGRPIASIPDLVQAECRARRRDGGLYPRRRLPPASASSPRSTRSSEVARRVLWRATRAARGSVRAPSGWGKWSVCVDGATGEVSRGDDVGERRAAADRLKWPPFVRAVDGRPPPLLRDGRGAPRHPRGSSPSRRPPCPGAPGAAAAPNGRLRPFGGEALHAPRPSREGRTRRFASPPESARGPLTVSPFRRSSRWCTILPSPPWRRRTTARR